MRLFVIFISGICFCSCGAGKQVSDSPRLANGELVYTLPDSLLTPDEQELKMKYVHLIPEDLLTSEQRELKERLGEVVTEYLKVENNRFVFKMNRKHFLERGLPAYYYDKLKNEVKVNNRFIRENHMTEIDEIYRKAVSAYRQEKEIEYSF